MKRLSWLGLSWLGRLGLLALLLASGGAQSKTVTYYYTDPQGTVLATADATGNVTSASDYRPYGTQALGTPEQGPSYTGHVNDTDSGLVYMQARYYDPSIGRFLSVDPKAPKSGDLTSVSRFAYANNSPIGNTDPDGRQSVPLEAYSRYWSDAPANQLFTQQNGNGAFVVFLITQSDVLDVAPAGSGSGAVSSSGFPGEFLIPGAIMKGGSLLASLTRTASQGASETLTGLPRMRITDITAKGARMQNYAVNWTKDQFESHLQANGYTSQASGPVNVLFDQSGAKVFSTRDFSRSGGPTGELYHSGQSSPVAKFRFDQNPGL
jgi:RHS repeat-associated protein